MKKILILLLFPLFSLSQALEPNNTYIISSGSNEGYDRPRVVITANNSPFIIWSKATNPKSIKAKRWNGSDFGSVLDIVSADLMQTGFIGPEIAAKGDTVYLIFESLIHNNHVIYLKRSFDGGLTFSDTIRVSDNSHSNKFAMPNIAVREDGNPIISYMESTTSWTDWKQMVKSSADFGQTFSNAFDVSALAPGEPCDCCQSTMVTQGNDDVFLLFRNDESNIRNTYIAKSTDGGVTFTTTQDLDDVNWILNACPTSSPVGAVYNDSVMVIRRNGGTGVNELYKSNVQTSDLQKSYYTQVNEIGFAYQDKAEIAVSSDGFFVTVWEDNRNGVKECFYNIQLSNGKSEFNGVISDTSVFGHKTEPDIAEGGPYSSGNFSIVYTASTQQEVHFVFSALMLINSIDEAGSLNKKLIKSVDLLGREVVPKSNKPFINIYDDGSVKRQLIINN